MENKQDILGQITIGENATVYGDVFTGDKTIVKRITTFFLGDTEEQRSGCNHLNMLQLVRNTWIEGVLKQSLHNEMLFELGMETQPVAGEHPCGMVVQIPDLEPRTVARGMTMLMRLCRLAIERVEEEPLHNLVPPTFLSPARYTEHRNLSCQSKHCGNYPANKYQIRTSQEVRHDATILAW